MKPLIKRLGHSYIEKSEKSKMAASKNNFMTNKYNEYNNEYIENQILFVNIK